MEMCEQRNGGWKMYFGTEFLYLAHIFLLSLQVY